MSSSSVKKVSVSAKKEDTPSQAEAAAQQSLSENLPLCWRVHLLRREPKHLSILLLVVGVGTGCVWLMFGTVLPVLAALALLVGSVSEYLFPITYRVTDREISVTAATSRSVLLWKDARRGKWSRDALLITSLAQPSRLDAFRGVLLRFAPNGEPGDRASVLRMIARCAPHLLPGAELTPEEKLITPPLSKNPGIEVGSDTYNEELPA